LALGEAPEVEKLSSTLKRDGDWDRAVIGNKHGGKTPTSDMVVAKQFIKKKGRNLNLIADPRVRGRFHIQVRPTIRRQTKNQGGRPTNRNKLFKCEKEMVKALIQRRASTGSNG